MTFGQRFKELRLEKGLTQQGLAEDFNKIYGHTFSKPSISQYENGKRTPENEALKNFASYFNVSIDYLLGVSDIRNNDVNIEKQDLKRDFLTEINKFFSDKNIKRDEKDKLYKELTKMYFDSL